VNHALRLHVPCTVQTDSKTTPMVAQHVSAILVHQQLVGCTARMDSRKMLTVVKHVNVKLVLKPSALCTARMDSRKMRMVATNVNVKHVLDPSVLCTVKTGSRRTFPTIVRHANAIVVLQQCVPSVVTTDANLTVTGANCASAVPVLDQPVTTTARCPSPPSSCLCVHWSCSLLQL